MLGGWGKIADAGRVDVSNIGGRDMVKGNVAKMARLSMVDMDMSEESRTFVSAIACLGLRMHCWAGGCGLFGRWRRCGGCVGGWV